jgi:hypothetical protein
MIDGVFKRLSAAVFLYPRCFVSDLRLRAFHHHDPNSSATLSGFPESCELGGGCRRVPQGGKEGVGVLIP